MAERALKEHAGTTGSMKGVNFDDNLVAVDTFGNPTGGTIPSDTELYGNFLPDGALEAQPTPEPDTPPEPEAPPAAEAEPEVEPEPVVPAPASDSVAEQLTEVNRKLGNVLNENAELRRTLEAVQQQANQPAPPAFNQSNFEWQLENNPLQAAEEARQRGDGGAYSQAIEVAHMTQPGATTNYLIRVAQLESEQRIAQQFQPQIQSAQAVAQRSELSDAINTVAARHPDFQEIVGTLSEGRLEEIVSNGFPVEVLQGLAGDQNSKERVFETLYRWEKSEKSDAVQKAVPAVQARQTEEAKQAKVEATVASANTTTPDLSAPSANPDDYPVGSREWEQAERDRMLGEFGKMSPRMRDGWKGQDTRRK